LLSLAHLGGGASRTKQGAVQWRGAKKGGTIFFGPYLDLPPGRHAAFCSFTANPRKGLAHLFFDVVYENVLFARKDIYLDMPGPRAVELTFTVPSRDDGWFDGAKFEFRLHVSGDTEVEVGATSLNVLADRGLAAAQAPSFGNALTALAIGPAGKRIGEGTIEAQPIEGCVFHGPYCFMLPGSYTLALVCDVPEPSDPDVELEVVAARDFVLARTHSVLKQGRNKIEVSFTVPNAADAMSLTGPLEFRLQKIAGSSFTCVRATLERAPEV